MSRPLGAVPGFGAGPHQLLWQSVFAVEAIIGIRSREAGSGHLGSPVSPQPTLPAHREQNDPSLCLFCWLLSQPGNQFWQHVLAVIMLLRSSGGNRALGVQGFREATKQRCELMKGV